MTLRAGIRSFTFRHVGGTALVLIYHRVTHLERDPQALAVTPEHFDEQMRMLARRHRVIPLSELLEGLTRRRIPDRALVVTFDDGYADNLLEAEPILARHGIPATVFVNSGFVGGEREFPWDELDALILAPGVLPERIGLKVAGAGSFSATIETTVYAEDDAARERDWSMLVSPRTDRQRLYAQLAAFLRPLSPGQREDVLGQLRTLAGRPAAVRETHRQLTADEVVRLDASPFVEVGAHTVDHVVLSALSAPEQRAEIEEDAAALTGLLRRSPRTFSYPYGSLADYSEETVALVRSAGFEGACSNHPGVVKPWTDRYRIPRNLVRDWDAAMLAEKIDGWFADPR